MWCSTSRMVSLSSARMWRSSSISPSTSSWFSPPAGSSSSSSLGWLISARASSTRFCVPKGRSATRRFATAPRSSSAITCSHVLAQLLLFAPHARQAQGVGQEAAVGAAVATEHHVLPHGHRAKQRQVLEGAADAQRGDAVRRGRGERRAVEVDLAFAAAVEPREAVEQRGLAGAVGPDQADDLAAVHGERDLVQGRDAAEANRHVNDVQERRGCARVDSISPRSATLRCSAKRNQRLRVRPGRTPRSAILSAEGHTKADGSYP